MSIPKLLKKSKQKDGIMYILSLILCFNGVFMSFLSYPNKINLYCRLGVIFGWIAICVCWGICIINKWDYKSGIKAVLKSFFFIGVIEIIYALLQLVRLLPSNNHYYSFTGTFDNPAVLSMLLSLCIPIGIYFTITSPSIYKIKWKVITLCMGIFVVLSASRTAIIATFCSCIIFYAENTKDFRQRLLRQKTTIVILLVILCVCLYYCKHASADGRLLIWRVSVNMIADKPFLGWGKDGFDAFYMPYQADYFITHPNSKFQLLADNIIHPFNEFLLFTIKYGMIGLVLLICFIILFFQNIMKYSEEYKDLWITLSSTIFIWSLFSYPYQIPFIWLVTVYIVSVNLFTITIRYKYTRILALCTCLTCIFILTCSIKSYKKSLSGLESKKKH